MIDAHALLIAIAIALTVWVGSAIGHGLKKVGQHLKHAGEKIVHVLTP